MLSGIGPIIVSPFPLNFNVESAVSRECVSTYDDQNKDMSVFTFIKKYIAIFLKRRHS